MDLRCTYCQTMFAISRDDTLAALEHMDEHHQTYYDAHCPRCRRANRVERFKLEFSFPNWRQVIAERVKEAPVAIPEAATPAPAPTPAPVATPAPIHVAVPQPAPKKRHLSHKPAIKVETTVLPKETPAATPPPKVKPALKPAATSSPKVKPAAKKNSAKPAVKKAPAKPVSKIKPAAKPGAKKPVSKKPAAPAKGKKTAGGKKKK